MLRNMKVSTKLVTVLAAPVLVLIILAAVGVQERSNESSDAMRVKELTEFVTVNSTLINALEWEMVLSGAFLGSDSSDEYSAQLDEQKGRTDEAYAAFTAAVDSVDPGKDSDAIADALDNAELRLANLKTYRTSVELGQSIPTDVISNYSSTAGDLIAVNSQMVQVASDPQLLLGLNTVANFERILQARSTTYALGVSVAAAGEFSDAAGVRCEVAPNGQLVTEPCVSFNAMTASLDQETQATTSFDENASKADKDVKTNAMAALPVDSLSEDIIQEGSEGNDVEVSAEEYLAEAQAATTGLNEVEALYISQVIKTANDLVASADAAARVYFVVALAAIAIALIIAYAVARATTGPLRKLTNAAYSLSTDKLPGLVERLRNPAAGDEPLSATLTPIDINSKDEIGQLADAFNSIQQVTVEVAEEQALLLRKGIGDIFINLARRNQTLLDRQIEFIDQLEAHEEDPDQLDNLFKLDHLATRMRRNAESLLVLAGAEPPRRRGRPVSLADVVRVAIGEVEDFARIQLLALDEATVGGNVAVDLAHLLSELMENATHFSPPDTSVEIVGHRAGAEGYILSVSDQGIGMTADQLAEANTQLARPPLVGLALSRSLGFIVIGRLSQRFSVSVKLTASPSGGVTALVTLPADLISYPDDELGDGADAIEAAVVSDTVIDDELAIDVTDSADGAVDTVEAEAVVDEVVAETTDEREPYGADDALDFDGDGALGDDLLDELVSEATPGDDEFDRGLQSLVSDELAPGPVEPSSDDRAGITPKDDKLLAPTDRVDTSPEPVAEPVAPAGPELATGEAKPLTAAGLVRRTPRKREASDTPTESAMTAARPTNSSARSPEEVRKMLSRYRSGLNKGRNDADSDSTTDS